MSSGIWVCIRQNFLKFDTFEWTFGVTKLCGFDVGVLFVSVLLVMGNLGTLDLVCVFYDFVGFEYFDSMVFGFVG